MQVQPHVLTDSPEYAELVAAKKRLIWPLLYITVGVYMAFILAIAFTPESLGKPMGDGVMSIGIVVGLILIAFNFLITLYYVRRANRDIQPLLAKVQAIAGDSK